MDFNLKIKVVAIMLKTGAGRSDLVGVRECWLAALQTGKQTRLLVRTPGFLPCISSLLLLSLSLALLLVPPKLLSK